MGPLLLRFHLPWFVWRVEVNSNLVGNYVITVVISFKFEKLMQLGNYVVAVLISLIFEKLMSLGNYVVTVVISFKFEKLMPLDLTKSCTEFK